MHQLLTPPQDVLTDRLVLAPVTPSDVDDLVTLLRAPDRVQVEHLVQEAIGSRIRHGLGSWIVRRRGDAALVGFGGMTMADGAWRFAVHVGAAYADEPIVAELRAAAEREAARLAPWVPIAA